MKKEIKPEPRMRNPLPELPERSRRTSVAASSSGIVAEVIVRASPVIAHVDDDPGIAIAPELVEFVAKLNTTAPLKATRSSDRVQNTLELHEALKDKWRNLKDAIGADAMLSVTFNTPLILLHRIDPTHPYRWIKDQGASRYGSNLYEVEVDAGGRQAISIEFK
jgi:hypothetical protein